MSYGKPSGYGKYILSKCIKHILLQIKDNIIYKLITETYKTSVDRFNSITILALVTEEHRILPRLHNLPRVINWNFFKELYPIYLSLCHVFMYFLSIYRYNLQYKICIFYFSISSKTFLLLFRLAFFKYLRPIVLILKEGKYSNGIVLTYLKIYTCKILISH